MDTDEELEFVDVEDLVVCSNCETVILPDEAFYDCHGFEILCPECESFFPENW